MWASPEIASAANQISIIGPKNVATLGRSATLHREQGSENDDR
jgi:hypothetical protein